MSKDYRKEANVLRKRASRLFAKPGGFVTATNVKSWLNERQPDWSAEDQDAVLILLKRGLRDGRVITE